MGTGIGQRVRRKEDGRLLTGQGCYMDDINLDGQAHAYFLRSPHAHARIIEIDAQAARLAPGVLGVWSAEDLLADGFRPAPGAILPVDVLNPPDPCLKPRAGTEMINIAIFPLALEKVRRVGECVVLVVGETLAQAQDAAELVRIEYQPLAAVIDAELAIAPGAPQLWDNVPGNVCLEVERGDKGATEKAMAQAAHRVALKLRNNRVAPTPMEPRGQVAHHDPASGRYTIHSGTGRTVGQKKTIARALGVAPDDVRIISRDVGGSFGARGGATSENTLIAWAARKSGRPVKWICERMEGFLSDQQARDLISHGELALDAEGRFLGLRMRYFYNSGTQPQNLAPLSNGMRLIPGSYRIPAAYVEAKAIVTNTQPTGTYRGAGRPEAIYNLERLIDAAALRLGIDRVEIRRRNLLRPDELPYTNAVGTPYDCGEFPAIMDQALAMADWDGFTGRRDRSEKQGKRRGIGIANYVQNTTGFLEEWTRVEVKPEGTVSVAIGTDPTGQGHETSFAQVIAEWLGVPWEKVNFTSGDTDAVRDGGGSHSDRAMRVGGAVMVEASEAIIEKGKRIAAHHFEASAGDIAFAEGVFSVAGTDRAMDIFEVARLTLGADLPEDLAGPLGAEADIDRYLAGYPSGCAVCEVEVDPDTGKLILLGYSTVDDVGRAINPMIVDGQTAGAIAQGVGQAFLENMVYDQQSGQVLSGSLMDYCLPRADDLPAFALGLHEVPTPSNALGVKGGGEGGTLPAQAALINALLDALSGLGVSDFDMPATPERVWRAIQAARPA